MKVTEEMIKKAKEMAEDPFRDYEYVGIRVQEVPFTPGEMTHVSHVWDNGDDTGEELDGVCAVSGKRAHLAVSYYGDHVAIIAGNSAEYGEDDGEIIIKDAVVVEVLA